MNVLSNIGKWFKEWYGAGEKVKDLTEAQKIYRLVWGLMEITAIGFGLNSSVIQLEGLIDQYIMQVALATGNMFYVYMVMIPGFIVLTALGLRSVLENDVGKVVYHTYKERFKK